MVLSFGGGLQTTALAILVYQGKVQVDEVVFADTGAEKPETYWYMESFTQPLFAELDIPFTIVQAKGHYGPSLYEWLWRYRYIPIPGTQRTCTDKFKAQPILSHIGKEAQQLIGFSVDEAERADKPIHLGKRFPLIEMGLTSTDCHRIISNFGWPIPVKSSCFFCPFQRWHEWNWLKLRHPELMQKAVALEGKFYERKPHLRHSVGLYGGKPLWKWAEGIQPEFGFPKEYSCWDGHCSY